MRPSHPFFALRIEYAAAINRPLAQNRHVFGVVDFLYDDFAIPARNRQLVIWCEASLEMLRRDSGSHGEHLKSLAELGAQPLAAHPRITQLEAAALPALAQHLPDPLLDDRMQEMLMRFGQQAIGSALVVLGAALALAISAGFSAL